MSRADATPRPGAFVTGMARAPLSPEMAAIGPIDALGLALVARSEPTAAALPPPRIVDRIAPATH